MSKVKPIPDGYTSVTPYLVVRNGDRALDFYTRAFGAKEHFRMPGPGGAIAHAELQIGDSILMLSDENKGMGALSPESLSGTPVSVFLYVEDVDATFSQAIAAGAKELTAPQDMFWGDRFGKLRDPFGHEWSIATHTEDVSPAEIEKRAKAAFGEAPG